MAIVPTLLKSGEIAIDIGANGANWTKILSRAVGPRGRVYAFEADPYYALATRHAVQLMGLTNVELFAFGLSDTTRNAYLRVQDYDGCLLTGTQAVTYQRQSGTVPIHLRQLDSLLESHPELRKTRLIKCDVEGHEPKVFEGAKALIDQARPIIIAEAESASELSRVLYRWGYTTRKRMLNSPNLIFESLKPAQP